jgi:hypothetical protein
VFGEFNSAAAAAQGLEDENALVTLRPIQVRQFRRITSIGAQSGAYRLSTGHIGSPVLNLNKLQAPSLYI